MADIAPDPELDDWALLQPAEATGDPIWRLAAYRNAAYFLTLARNDAAALGRESLRIEVGSQLLRATGSIAANVAESSSASLLAFVPNQPVDSTAGTAPPHRSLLARSLLTRRSPSSLALGRHSR